MAATLNLEYAAIAIVAVVTAKQQRADTPVCPCGLRWVYLHTFLLFFSFLYHFSACIWHFFCTFAQVKFECAVCAHNHIFCCWMNILVGVDVIELLW